MTIPIKTVSEAFKQCIDIAKNSSPLYEALASHIVDDTEILEIASVGREEQFPPMMLFGAVRYLLLEDAMGDELRNFYLDLANSGNLTTSPQDAYPHFRKFCLKHKDRIQDILTTRMIQTNEVRRCAVMLPAFSAVAELTGQALSLIEIGASAGLNLNWDYYRYHYTGKVDSTVGQSDSTLIIEAEIKGENIPPIPEKIPLVLSRKGIDLNPLNPADENVARWLHALIWPEHIERWQHLEQALSIVQENPPELIAGDALVRLPEILVDADDDGALCVFHSTTIYQFSEGMKQKLDDILIAHSEQHDIYRVWFEWEHEQGAAILRLISYKQGAVTNTMLAKADPHGKWMMWQAQE